MKSPGKKTSISFEELNKTLEDQSDIGRIELFSVLDEELEDQDKLIKELIEGKILPKVTKKEIGTKIA